MRILLGWAWTYLIVAEVVGTMSGITFFINQQARYRNFDNVYAAIGMIGIIGFTTDLLLAWLGRVIFPWKRRTRARVWRPLLVVAILPQPAPRPSPPAHDDDAATRPPSPITGSSRPEVAARFEQIRQRPVLLSVRDLQKSFGVAAQHASSIDLSLDIHRREFICVIGPSGCGKSTLIRIVAGLDEATGRRDAARRPSRSQAPGRDRGMVFQGYTLFPWRTVKKNVMFGLEMQGSDRRPPRPRRGSGSRWWASPNSRTPIRTN